jgi:hypothetical protein
MNGERGTSFTIGGFRVEIRTRHLRNNLELQQPTRPCSFVDKYELFLQKVMAVYPPCIRDEPISNFNSLCGISYIRTGSRSLESVSVDRFLLKKIKGNLARTK